ncbi:MAG: hypothetical protein V4659_03275 [Pseudomonadota bacterium]
MEAFTFVLAIMGCGDAGEMCEQARLEPTRYTSIQACQAAAPAALQRNTDLSYPMLTAACRSTAPQMAKAEVRPRG